MMRLIAGLALTAVLGLGVALAEAPKPPATNPSTQPAATVNKFCPIEKEAVDPKVTIQYEGKTIGFCCSMCIPKFQKDPAKYMADLK